MVQPTLEARLTGREAKLGRAMGESRSAHGVVLLLPAGAPRSVRRRSPVTAAAMVPLARRLVRAGARENLVAHVVHYRCRGWNGGAAHTAHDARWAVEEAVRIYGDVPVCLAGVDVGARAALRAAGHPAVAAVVALGPWLPEGGQDPVDQLRERRTLLVHGSDDAACDPELSYRLAERAKKAGAEVCRFEVHTDGHGLHRYRAEVAALAEDFVLGALCGRDFSRPVTDALAAPPPLGLRMPLASGYGAARAR
jgi:hypothetical protein